MHPLEDVTPITEQWLRSIGFKPKPCALGRQYEDDLCLGKLAIYNWNYTDEWLTTTFDPEFSLKTRGQVRMLARLLDEPLIEQRHTKHRHPTIFS